MPIIPFDSIIQVVIYVVILMIGTVSAIYVLGLFRANPLQQEHDIDKGLDYFRELNDEGKLSDVEFRNIKERLSELIVDASKNNKERKTGLILDYKEPLSLLFRVVDSGAASETQIVGRSECINENGQAEYIEPETKRMRDRGEDRGIDYNTDSASDDNLGRDTP
ncbi:MAG: hypothetical protein LBK06_06325 [Planctomycetaceae bacterium]|jgi:hypothetical protein|nr:hypothetical protein [Planctomycetaceae bacterium]